MGSLMWLAADGNEWWVGVCIFS